ncbi:hypothetical protein B0F90DRAFT_1781322, partial [Multifurca ochricompacta]
MNRDLYPPQWKTLLSSLALKSGISIRALSSTNIASRPIGRKYKFLCHIKLQHELTQASIRMMETVTRRLRRWRTCFSWVSVSFIPGLGDFRGRVLHSALWDVTRR